MRHGVLINLNPCVNKRNHYIPEIIQRITECMKITLKRDQNIDSQPSSSDIYTFLKGYYMARIVLIWVEVAVITTPFDL